MNNRTLGVLAMIGAPFLFIDFCIHGSGGIGDQFEHTSLSGVFSLIYISAWMCSMIGLKSMHAAGNSKGGNIWMIIPLVTLTLANMWNVWEIVQPGSNAMMYRLLDAFWPVSNTFMFFYGIRVIWIKELQGWKRYVPLMVGFWLPFSVLLNVTTGPSTTVMMLSGLYSAVTWTVLGYVVFTSQPHNKLAYIPLSDR